MASAIEMNPREPHAKYLPAFIARAYIADDDLAAAETWSRRTIASDPTSPVAHFLLAAALARLGRIEEARAAFARGDALRPGFAVQWSARREYRDEAANDQLIEALRLAGLPQ